MVTYNMGKDMDLPALIKFCEDTGLEGVELRTTHAHGVEVELSADERADVKRRFADSNVEIAGLGSAFEYHSPDPAVVKENIEGSIAYARLAADVGTSGIKVRPNGLPEEVPIEKTCEQIGKAIRQVAQFAGDIGVEVRLEVHGKNSSEPKIIREIVDYADHPMATVCWNSNPTDMDENQSIEASFNLLKDKITHCHITEIGVYQYPWQDLFDRLKAMDYQGWCLAEIGYNEQPDRFMKFYRTLFDLYTGNYSWPHA
jgi:sugar phosphate isomerase/epimerase